MTVSHKTRRKSRTAMLIIEEGGIIRYRTRLVRNMQAALRFAKCVEANPHFQQAEVVKSSQSKGEAWFVTYRPKSADRQESLVERLQAERSARARKECGQYKWTSVTGKENTFYCKSKSGSVYEVSPTRCDCPDYVNHCHDLDIYCKHQIALFDKQLAEDIEALPDEPSPFAPPANFDMAAEAALDFP